MDALSKLSLEKNFSAERSSASPDNTRAVSQYALSRALQAIEHPENIDTRTSWQNDAACADKDPWMFELRQGTHSADDARAICMGCVVWKQCLMDMINTTERQDSIATVRAGLDAGQQVYVKKTYDTYSPVLNKVS